MQEFNALLLQFGIVLFTALVLGSIAEMLSLPSLLGYFFAGILLGHQGLNLVPDVEGISLFADLGIMLLMFYIGLEFNFEKMTRSGLYALFLSPLKSGVGFLLGYMVGKLLGFTTLECFVIGAGLAVSSTAIISQIIIEKGWFERLASQISISMLLLEDIFAVVFIAYLLGKTGGDFSLNTFLLHTVLVLALLLIIGSKMFSKFMGYISKHVRGTTLAAYSLGLLVLFSFVLSALGLSPVLGAFFAGVMISETAHARRIERELDALKNVFIIVFFTSLGLMYTIDLTPRAIVLMLLAIAVQFAQGLVLLFFGPLLGVPPRTMARVSIMMLPVGEFSLLFAATAQAIGLAGASEILAAMFGVILLSTFVVSIFFRMGEALERKLTLLVPPSITKVFEKISPYFLSANRAYLFMERSGFINTMERKVVRILQLIVAIFTINYFAGYLATTSFQKYSFMVYFSGFLLSLFPLYSLIRIFLSMFHKYVGLLLDHLPLPPNRKKEIAGSGCYVVVGFFLFVFAELLALLGTVFGILTFQLVSALLFVISIPTVIYGAYKIMAPFVRH